MGAGTIRAQRRLIREGILNSGGGRVSFAVGETIGGRYRLDRLLGSGGSSDAYLAQDLDLAAPRVLKIGLRPTPAKAREALRREHAFLKERREAAFPACFTTLAWNGHTVLVLEYVEGQTLDSAELPPAASGLLATASRLLDLLETLHGTGSVCRDLKPQNVLVPLDPAGAWKLIDLSTVCHDGEAPAPLGTPEFAAPEVVSGRIVSTPADLFSLGKTVIHLAAARQIDVPPPIQRLLAALTEADPGLRPAAAQARDWIQSLWAALREPQPVCLTCFSRRGCRCPVLRAIQSKRSRLVLELVDRSLKQGDQASLRWFLNGDSGGARRLPLEPHDRLELAQALLKTNDANSALALLEDDDAYGRGGCPRPLLASLQLRLVFLTRGAEAAGEAISAWSDTLDVEPKWVRNATRVLHDQLGRTEEALSLLRSCLERNPKDGPTHARLAALLPPGSEQGHHLHEAAFGEPPDPGAVEKLCRQHEAEGELRHAIALAHSATRALPQDARPKRLYADLCLGEPGSWPTLESELRTWLSVQPDDGLLERLVALYARSDKWKLLLDESLPAGVAPETQALMRAARAAASKAPQPRRELSDVDWRLATPLRWLPVLGELVQRMVAEGDAAAAKAYVEQLPESFAPYLEVLDIPDEPPRVPAPEIPPPSPVAPPVERPAPPPEPQPVDQIPYPRRSKFVAPLLEGLRSELHALRRGEEVTIQLKAEKAGFPGRLKVTIDQQQAAGFRSDWSGSDVTLFPARLRACAWALFRLGEAGEFLVSHKAGRVDVRSLAPSERPAPTSPVASVPTESVVQPQVQPQPARQAPPPPPQPTVPAVEEKYSLLLRASVVWQHREEALSPRVDRALVYRLIDALGDARSLHENEVTRLLGIPRRRLAGFVSEVARGLNIDGEDVIAHDRRTQVIALNLTLFEQCFDVTLQESPKAGEPPT